MIGLNYVYYYTSKEIILKNYLIFFGILLGEITTEIELNPKIAKKIMQYIKKTPAKKAKMMIKSSDEKLFDSPLIKELLELAYDYEIQEKFLKKTIQSSPKKNKRIANIFSSLYSQDFNTLLNNIPLSEYTKHQEIFSTYTAQISKNIHKDIQKFFSFIFLILTHWWYTKQKNTLQKIIASYTIKVVYDQNNSSFVHIWENSIIISLNSKKKTTLYHECTHLIQKIIKKDFTIHYKDFEIHTYNEWMANFFAYNLFDAIEMSDITKISLQYIYFPRYSYLYKQLFDHWSNSAKKNYSLIKKECKQLWYTKNEEIKNLYYRFFKFFPLHQHIYMYPKELLYQIGYEAIICSFKKKNTAQHLADLLFYTQPLPWK